MRIGIDTHAAEQDGSGNCRYIRNLVQQLVRTDTQNSYVFFVTDANHSFYARLPETGNFQIHPISGKPAWFRVFFSLPFAAHRQEVDLLHVQYFAPVFYHCKLVVTIHDLIPFIHPEHFSFYERMLFRFLLPRSIRRASRILTVSETSKKDLVRLFNTPEEKIAVTYDGVDPIFTDPAPGQSDHETLGRYGVDKAFFLCVGRIDSRKNLPQLIEAFDHLKTELRIPHQLVIIGKHYFEKDNLGLKIQSLASNQDILLTGYVPDKDLSAFYRSATALIVLSEYEGFGLPALEAMSCGTPVVASDIPVFHEILNETCLFVNQKKKEDVVEAIRKLLTNSGLSESLKQKGLERATMFRWEATAKSTVEAYFSVLSKRTP
jgi:glycosyltransferase involved in cell wall biosynthesis